MQHQWPARSPCCKWPHRTNCEEVLNRQQQTQQACALLQCAGGEGGAISAQDAFLAVINSTITGIPPLATSNTTDTQRTAHDAALQSNGRGRYQNIVMTAFVGGCLSVQASKLLVSGSRFRYCNARFVGGGMSILESTAVIQDTVLSQNYADMVSGGFGKALHLLSSVLDLCRCSQTAVGDGLHAAAWLPANKYGHVHAFFAVNSDLHHTRLD